MKTFVVELYFACDSTTTMGELDEIPRLDSYRAETVFRVEKRFSGKSGVNQTPLR